MQRRRSRKGAASVSTPWRLNVYNVQYNYLRIPNQAKPHVHKPSSRHVTAVRGGPHATEPAQTSVPCQLLLRDKRHPEVPEGKSWNARLSASMDSNLGSPTVAVFRLWSGTRPVRKSPVWWTAVQRRRHVVYLKGARVRPPSRRHRSGTAANGAAVRARDLGNVVHIYVQRAPEEGVVERAVSCASGEALVLGAVEPVACALTAAEVLAHEEVRQGNLLPPVGAHCEQVEYPRNGRMRTRQSQSFANELRTWRTGCKL
jgi:hypothetical protein